MLILETLICALRFPLKGEALDLSPSGHWTAPPISAEDPRDDGPVLVTVEYLVASVKVPEFLVAMQAMRRMRRRDGAVRWSLYEDAARPGTMVETFIVQSWLEHLRQHERLTNADRVQQDALAAFRASDAAPLVRHPLLDLDGAALGTTSRGPGSLALTNTIDAAVRRTRPALTRRASVATASRQAVEPLHSPRAPLRHPPRAAPYLGMFRLNPRIGGSAPRLDTQRAAGLGKSPS